MQVSLTAADGDHSYSEESQLKVVSVQELMALPQSMDCGIAETAGQSGCCMWHLHGQGAGQVSG